MSEYQIIDAWRELDLVLLAIFSIFMAGTFAVAVAAYNAGSELGWKPLGFMVFACTVFSGQMATFIYGQVDRIRSLEQAKEKLLASDVTIYSDLSSYQYYESGPIVIIGTLLLVWAGATFFVVNTKMSPSN